MNRPCSACSDLVCALLAQALSLGAPVDPFTESFGHVCCLGGERLLDANLAVRGVQLPVDLGQARHCLPELRRLRREIQTWVNRVASSTSPSGSTNASSAGQRLYDALVAQKPGSQDGHGRSKVAVAAAFSTTPDLMSSDRSC
jgi:hypothetical protein